MRIKNSLKAFAATALVAGAVLSASTQQSHAIPKALPYAGPAVAGKWATGSIVGIASFLAVYDIIRRTTCSGDFLRLGGPGFGEPINPSANVLVPRRCR